MIDNYDSFTFNLVHYLGELGAMVTVYRNDALTVDEALSLEICGIVISPGPCTPTRAGICLDLIRALGRRTIPTLGVCLGHQAVGQAFGGRVIQASRPMHGKITPITHDQERLFATIPTPFKVTRYHSLILERETLPSDLIITAQDSEEIIMGVRHRHKPLYGIQFHPESIRSEYGHAVLNNFLQVTRVS